MSKITSSIVHGIQQVKQKVKKNYNYFKRGRRAEFDEENRRLKESNMKRLKSNW